MDNERVMELYRGGASDKAIADKMGVTTGTVWQWRKRRGLPANFPPFGVRRAGAAQAPVRNAAAEPVRAAAEPARKRNPCRGCVYWCRVNGQPGEGSLGLCEYLLVTGHRRPCPPGADCTAKRVRASAARAAEAT